MTNRELAPLRPEFQVKADQLDGMLPFDLLIYCTVRTAREQAILWRRGRSLKKIEAKAKWLEKFNPELAHVLMDVGPQMGTRIVTKAGPGESWHQYGLALDAAPLIGGRIPWSGAHEEWRLYGQACADLGLNWGGNWSFKDLVHCQLPLSGNPLREGVEGCVIG